MKLGPMKNHNSKSQGAMEYVMTYGWAILVVMIIGLALWRLGIFGTSTSPTTASGFLKITPLQPSLSLTPECNFYGIFINNAGYNIHVNNITIHHQGDNSECQYEFSGTGNFKVGEKIYIKYGDCCPSSHSEGESYVLKFRINYTGEVTGVTIEKVEVGYIHGDYEDVTQPIVCKEWYYGTSQQGHCCSASSVCAPAYKLAAMDCAECCEGSGNTHCT